MSIYALVSSVMVMTIFAFAYSFAATYVSRGHVFFSDINVTFAGTTMESINFNTTGYVNQEWYTCYAAGYRNPGGATVAHGTERFSAMTTACQRFVRGTACDLVPRKPTLTLCADGRPLAHHPPAFCVRLADRF